MVIKGIAFSVPVRDAQVSKTGRTDEQQRDAQVSKQFLCETHR